MKYLLALVAAAMVSAQAGYCAAPALESLELMSDTKDISAALRTGTAIKPAAVSAGFTNIYPGEKQGGVKERPSRKRSTGIIATSYEDLAGQLGYFDFESRTDLSENERTALTAYKSGARYDCIQLYLFNSGAVDGFSCSYMSGDPAKRIPAIIAGSDSALARSKKLPGGLFLFRGQGKITEEPGAVLQRKAYTSTSLSPGEARKFYKGALLAIKIPAGGSQGLLMTKWEEEVLLPRDARFLILDKKRVNGEDRVLAEVCGKTCEFTPPNDNWWDF